MARSSVLRPFPGHAGDATLADDLPSLLAWVRDGGRLLVAQAPGDDELVELTGVCVVESLPDTEWFVTLTDRPEAARLDGEVPVRSPLRLLLPDEAEVVATTSVHHQHRPTIVRRRLGRGVVITSGVADLDALMGHGVLGTYVRRLASDPPPSQMPKTLGVAVVGYGPFGGMGYTHGLACTETDGLEFVAAVDTVQSRLDAATDDFPDIATYTSADDAANDPNVDIAVIATPPVLHADLARQFLAAGNHVVVEKPMCLRKDDADELIRLAAEVDRVITVHQSRRWDRDVLALRRVIDAGDIGDVFNVETFVGSFEHPCRAWHSEESISGGAIYDWGSHHVDWILAIHGRPPARVLCVDHHRVWHDTTNADQLSLWMQWDDGVEATFRQSDVAAIRRPKFYVQGTEGTIEGHYRPLRSERVEPGRGHLDGWHHHAEAPADLTVARYRPGGGIVTSSVEPASHPGWGFHHNLADHLLLGEPLAVDPIESRNVVAVLEAAHRSAMAGGEVIELA